MLVVKSTIELKSMNDIGSTVSFGKHILDLFLAILRCPNWSLMDETQVLQNHVIIW